MMCYMILALETGELSPKLKSYGANAVGIEADPIRVLWSPMFLFLHRIRDINKY